LRSYTVYLDLWVVDRAGRVVANGRPGQYRRVSGSDVSREAWFAQAMQTRDGDAYAVTDIVAAPALDGAAVGTYATAIRKGGETDGAVLGALGIFFDWAPQADAVVRGVSLSQDERAASRVMLVDASHLIIAASDGQGVLAETYPLKTRGQERGYYLDDGRLVSFARTPGYETYRGLGWYGVVEHRLQDAGDERRYAVA
jgi:hypothetical protein